jgi:U1 small nuclear ribonucleoprotein
LSYETTEERLKREFHGVFGEVVHVHIVKDTKTGKSRGYGFVEFSDDREADGK